MMFPTKSEFDFFTHVAKIAELLGSSSVAVPAGCLPEAKASFVIDECPIDIICAPEKSSLGIFRCGFGAPPSTSFLQSYGSLLRFNFQHYSPGGCSTFGLDPATGHVMFHSELLLEMLTPQMTLDYMAGVAAMRRLWREGRL